jgi:hypothetical protein
MVETAIRRSTADSSADETLEFPVPNELCTEHIDASAIQIGDRMQYRQTRDGMYIGDAESYVVNVALWSSVHGVTDVDVYLADGQRLEFMPNDEVVVYRAG